MVMPYHLHMPSYFLETFTEYPKFILCHFNELYFNFFIWVICLNFNANFVA